jgi:uncharacterized protein YcfJ
MKKAFAIFLFVLTTAAFNASAAEVLATIVDVTPVFSDRYQQTRVCDVIQGRQPQQDSAVNSGSVIGGIAGALLGSRVGDGNGRLAATALGAVTGAMTGDRLAQRDSQPQQACRWVQQVNQQVSGYHVTYAYQGEHFYTSLPYDPSRGGAVSTIRAEMTLSLR